MLRKFFTLLLCLVLLLGLMSPAVSAEEEDGQLLEVTLNVHSDRKGQFEMDGIYMDNVLYIHPHTVCELTGAYIHEDMGDSITFSLHGKQRLITVSPEDGGWLEETLTMGRTAHYRGQLPVIYCAGEIYASATHLLRYMGAVVGFGMDETAQTHMTVQMNYTMMDLIRDLLDYKANKFSWAEAEGSLLQPEDLVPLAALDTVFFGYETSLLAYAAPGRADQIGTEYYTDVLEEILRNEGAELVSSGYSEVDLFGDASDITSFSADWIKEVLDWVQDPKLLTNVNKSMSGLLDGYGYVLSAGGDYLKSLDTAVQFANMSTSQQQLLDMTLNALPEKNVFCQELPHLFAAAEQTSAMISGEHNAHQAAAWNSIYNLMIDAGVNLMSGINPFSLAWDTLTTAIKLDPLAGGILHDEKCIAYTVDCINVQNIAWYLMAQDYNDLYAMAFYMNRDQSMSLNYQDYLRMDIILALKSTLTARCLMADTGMLTGTAQSSIEYEAQQTAKLLQKAQNAKPVIFKTVENRNEDLTWIENLAGIGAMGNVVSSGGKIYYWEYDAESFYEYGAVGFSKVGTVNRLMCMDKKGNSKLLLELDSHGPFAIVNNSILFYSNSDNEICSITLNGENHKSWGQGYLQGVTEDGAYVYYENYDGNLMAIRPMKQDQITVGRDMDYVTQHNGRLYTTDDCETDAAQSGQVTLYSQEPDGSDRFTVCTTESLYEFHSGFSYADVAQMRFTEDYLYFSYGSIAGTGLFFQGGKIVRAKYDGSESVVVAGSEELVSAQFSVNADGSVNANAEEYSEIYFDYMRRYGVSNGTIFRYDDMGYEVALAGFGDYDLLGPGLAGVYDSDTGSIIQLDFVEAVDGKAFYLLHLAVPNTGSMTSWREEYARGMTVMYMKDLKTGAVKALFQIPGASAE